MKRLHELSSCLEACHAAGRVGRLGLVPTMGALHEGHLSLVRRARAECDTVAVTIFVNPLQFDEAQDLERYPRPLDADCALLEGAGADLVLVLAADQMYPDGFATRITQTGLTTVLEGASRPGHFDGVLTVVTKLFGIAGPCRAYFGRKDFQQTVVVGRLIADLHLPVELVVCELVRDADGLALSSRNAFLSSEERARGLCLVRGLRATQARFDAGERAGPVLTAALVEDLTRALGRSPDYAAVVSPRDMAPVDLAAPGDVVVVAGRVGDTRLLDNHVLGGSLPA